MFNINKLFLIVFLLFFGCTSTSMEFSSAKSAARAEKDLKRGEEWGLKALEVETDKDNALVPYFIATEIYKPQERWEEMAEMLDEAMRRNPEQKLEKPIILESDQKLTKDNFDKLYIDTIEKAVKVYRDEAWTTLYNKYIENLSVGNNEGALGKLDICIKIDPGRVETYVALVKYYFGKKDFKTAKEYVDKGINADASASILYAMRGELLSQEFQLSKDNTDLLHQSEQMYLKAIDLADDADPIKKQLMLIYIDMGKSQKAIDISNELLNIYYDDPDLYFNVGVLYQRLATDLYDPTIEEFNKLNAEKILDTDMVVKIYKDFIQAQIYAEQSREKFLEANDLEIEDTGSRGAAAEMKNLIKKLKNTFIPSIKKTAESEGINLN